jgi:hypothetical protein
VNYSGQYPDFDSTKLVALQNIEMVDLWPTKPKAMIVKKYSGLGKLRTEGEIIREHNSSFTCWFKDRVMATPRQ